MPNTSVIGHDDMSDEFMPADGEVGSSLATLEPECMPPSETDAYTGPCCEKCNVPLKSGVVAICQSCGWYASLGTFVEVDPSWETAMDGSESAAPAAQRSHLQVWIDLVPRWGWVIIGSVLAVVVESVVARLATPADSSLRTTWSLGQLVVGVITVVSCHVFNFLSLAGNDADVGLLDLLLKPVKLWIRTCHNLPKRLWFVDAAVCGLTATVMSLVVIGGIPYERFWDWGFTEPPKQNLLGAVMDRAKEIDSRDDNLEDAIGDFAGKQNLTGEDLPKAEPPKPRAKADCVILGFQVDRDGRLSTLLVGSAHRKRLAFAGHVTPKLPDGELNELLQQLKAIATKQPFISIAAENSIWVKPKFTCRVSFSEQERDGRLLDPQWDTMLGSMKTKQ